MPFRFFDGSDDVIRWSIGALTATTCNSTIVAILKRSSMTTIDTILGLHSSGGTAQPWLKILDTDVLEVGHQTGTQVSSFTVASTEGWVLVAASKSSGTTTPRFHKYNYTSDTWTHSDAAGTLTNGSSPGAGGYAENSWQGGDLYHGDLGVLGVFPGNLTDAQIETLAFSLTAWYSLTPTAMWVLDQSATTQNVPDLTGGGANQSSLTGTVLAGAGGPVFTYGASPVLVTVTALKSGPPDRLNTTRRRHRALLVR